jgi:hypothetical protein
MKPFLFWLSELADSMSVRLELLANWLRDKSRTPDYVLPYYTEGPEGDQ